ncbi:MAG: CvpA family protein [Planctomycetota bacterium]
MNALDGIIIGILLFFVIMGLLRGWFAQLLQISAIVAALITAGLLHSGLAASPVFNHLREKSDSLANAVGFMIIFLVVSVFLTIVSALLFDLGRPDRLSFSARMLGSLISTLTGVLILSCICWVATEWKSPTGKKEEESFAAELINDSALVPQLSGLCENLSDLFPNSYREHGKELFDAGKEQIKKATTD